MLGRGQERSEFSTVGESESAKSEKVQAVCKLKVKLGLEGGQRVG